MLFLWNPTFALWFLTLSLWLFRFQQFLKHVNRCPRLFIWSRMVFIWCSMVLFIQTYSFHMNSWFAHMNSYGFKLCPTRSCFLLIPYVSLVNSCCSSDVQCFSCDFLVALRIPILSLWMCIVCFHCFLKCAILSIPLFIWFPMVFI